MRGKDMKMKNLVKTFVLAFGTLASALAVEAGDIFSIEPVSGSCEPSSALKSGQKLQFMMRLLARDWEADAPGAWEIVHMGLGSAALDDAMFPPKVGIVVSGQLRFAELYDIGPNTEKGAIYTDLMLEYTVQPGDFALPVNLALAGSTAAKPLIPNIDEIGAASGYYIANVVGADVNPKWKFQSIDDYTTSKTTNTCDFTWTTVNANDLKVAGKLPGNKLPTVDADLSKASFYVKSIDFDDDNPNYDPEDAGTYWRTVHENTTETVPAPTIETIGISSEASAPTESVRLYVWAEDENVAFMDGANVTKMTLHLPPNGATTGQRNVYVFDLVTGVEKYPVKFKGKTRGLSTKLILSATPDYQYNKASGALVTSFLSRPVFVDEPPKPNIKIGWDPEGQTTLYPDVVTAFSNDWSEVAEQGIPLYVIPSEAFETDTTMHLRAKIARDEVTDYAYVFTNKLIGTLSGERQSYTTPQVETNITFRAGDKSAKIFWVYPAGGTAETKNPGVEFTVEFDAATPSTYENNGKATLRFQDPKPSIVSPTASDSFTFSSGSCTIPVVVMDSYRDLSAPRTYTVQVIANGTVLCTSNEVPFRSGESTAMVLNSSVLAKLQGPEAKEMKLTVKVTDPLNQSATSEVVQLLIPAKEKTPTVSAVLYDTSGTTRPHDGNEFEEGQVAYVRFTLEPEASERALHAYLVPRNEASSNLVEIAKAVRDNGILIQANKTNSNASAALTLLDGTALTDGSSGQIEFDIVLKDDDGNVDTTYVPASPALELTVKNVPAKPEENGLYINGAAEAIPSGGELVDEISSGAPQSFTASYGDVSTVDITNCIMTVWCFTDGKKGGTYHYFSVTSKTESATIEHTFNTAGATQKVMFFVVDKDTLAAKTDGKTMADTLTEAELKALWTVLAKTMSPYTVTVHVGDAPKLVFGVEELTFDETSKTAKLPITLSQAYEEEIYLKATAKPMIAGADNPGRVSFKDNQDTVWLTVPANATEPKKEGSVYSNGLLFDYTHLDGTAFSAGDGWEITLEAYVENDDGDRVKFSRYADGSAYVYVKNAPPQITKPASATVVTNKSITVNQAFTINWAVKDVAADLDSAEGLTARWYIDDIEQGDKVVKNISDNSERSTTLTLKEDGSHVVRLEVTDKDEDEDGKATHEWYYYITPTKTLEVRATGPTSATKTKYLTAGKGRVWANGIKCVAEDFAQNWTYSVKTKEAEVHAYGYAASNTVYHDDGKLGVAYEAGYRDIAIDANGNSVAAGTPSANCYEIDGKYDSFFYRWAIVAAREGGGAGSTVTYGDIEPTARPGVDKTENIPLDAYEENKESYSKVRVEAVFSRELLPSDNMGDINLDGIPDLYVKKYGFGVVDENGTQSGDDLKAITTEFAGNDDEDYLPASGYSSFTDLIPGPSSEWIEFGFPFTARLEIRGYGDGLNDAPYKFGDLGDLAKPDIIYEVDGRWNETNCTISKVEYLAWCDAGKPANWSPECPTDPTKADTDDDGLPDGYEYYLWYQAHVGYLEYDAVAKREVHRYLTGERYDPANPGVGTPISRTEIERLFNPRAATGSEDMLTRDTDNDGLPDLLEFEIGTNPVHWDTDGDGLPDGYEAMYATEQSYGSLECGMATPLDPLKGSTTPGLIDSVRNYDGDYMAFYTNLNFSVFALEGGERGVSYYAGATDQLIMDQFAMKTNEVGEIETTDGWYVELADGRKVMTTSDIASRVYLFEGNYYLAGEVDGSDCWEWAEVKIGNKTVAYRSVPVALPRGTQIACTVDDTSDPAVTNATILATNCVTFVTDFGRIEIKEDVMGNVTTNKILQPWNEKARPPQRAYRVWQYGIKSVTLAGRDPRYGGWALSGEAFLANGTTVLKLPQADTVWAYHNLAFSKAGFDPRTAWTGAGEISVGWQIADVTLAGGATNHLSAVNTIAYNDYDEFLLFSFFVNNSEAGLSYAEVLPRAKDATWLLPADYAPMPRTGRPWQRIWGSYCSNAYDPDTDGDGIPDGWELYVMGGPDLDDDNHPRLMAMPGPVSPYSPLVSLDSVVTKDSDGDGLDERGEFYSVQSVKVYESVSTTITVPETYKYWTNKSMPTNPWESDTDGDGLSDGEEFLHFVYGEPEGPGAGGGLNPLSWDTDGDGLPDPWEVQYAGSYEPGTTTESTETTVGSDGTSNTVTTVTRNAGTWSGGMDGTTADAMEDYDADGLLNWQEYMVGSMRHFRYDDTVSIWGNNSFSAMEMQMAMMDEELWNEFWGHHLVDEQNYHGEFNPHFVDGTFDGGSSWFSLCTNEWDTAKGGWYMFYDGIYHDLSKPPARYRIGKVQYNRFSWKYMENGPANFPFGPILWAESVTQMYIPPKEYVGTDPTKPDTDNDGMDDFYELFHGLNPLLGTEGANDTGHRPPVDRVFEAYGGRGDNELAALINSAKNNYWLNGDTPHGTIKAEPDTKYGNNMDFMQYPWLAGLAAADPDGDNLRNQMEAIMANRQAASTYLHTDPSPLWMTDVSYAYSFTTRYYQPIHEPSWILKGVPGTFEYDSDGDGEPEVYEFKQFPGFTYDEAKGILTTPEYDLNRWNAFNYVASFEQNEGYDSDHDYLSDFEEAQGRTKTASDPQDSDGPSRRQAMWLNGKDAFLQTPLAASEPSPVDGIGIQPEEPFLYFTVECWAKPEDPERSGVQTLVERAIWTGSANAADEKLLRKNFLLGIKDGHWYVKYDSTGTDALKAEEINDGPQASTNWTHVAATYDGDNLRLFVNGACVKTKPTQVQPEHGTEAATINEAGELRDGKQSYSYSSFLVGASARTFLGIVFDSLWRGLSKTGTSFSDYDSFYKGYVDEVRIWDGARTELQVGEAYGKRFTAADAIENRNEFFKGWSEYGTRAPSTKFDLCAELRYHFTFDHIPGAVDAKDVMKVPAGFATAAGMTDSMAIWARPRGWICQRWGGRNPFGFPYVAVRSTVYSDAAWVPWVNNTVTHLPRFDLTTQDSFYWSENYSGAETALSLGFKSFQFPRTHEVPSVWTPMTYNKKGAWRSTPTRYNVINGEPVERAWEFTLRHSLVEGGDLLPMGGAYAKRISAAEGGMWDGQGAADAWAQTGTDTNADGLPDWWEAYARANYAEDMPPDELLTWNSVVIRNGIPMTAMQAYLRDLAEGLLLDGEFHDEFRDTVDTDGDGLPDWWEEYWALKNGSGLDDFDHDGLSNFQEWKLSEDEANGFGTANGYPLVNPTLIRTADGQVEPDYFLRLADGDANGRFKGLYLGEIVADHDFMEDDQEADLGTDRTLYDAYSDNDEDGWTAWSELRYSTFKMTRAARFVSHIVGDEEVKDFPIPVINATLRYNGVKKMASTNATIVVEAYSGNNLQQEPTAVYTIKPGSSQERELYLGAWENRVVHGTLTPGRFVKAGLNLVQLQGAFVQPDDLFSWTINDPNATAKTDFLGTYDEMYAAYLQYGTNMTVSAAAFEWKNIVEGDGPVEGEQEPRNVLQITLDEKTQKGHFIIDAQQVGDIDLATGDFTFDLGKLKGMKMKSGIAFEQMFYRLHYTATVPALQTKALSVSLANADAGNLVEGTTAFVAYMDLDGDGYTPGVDPIGFAKGVAVGWDRVADLTIEMTDASQAAGKRFAYGDEVKTLRVIRTAINGKEYLDEKGEKPVKRRIVYSRDAEAFDRRYVYEGDLVTDTKFGLDWAGLRTDLESAGLDPRDVTEVSYLVVGDATSVNHVDEEDIIDTITVSYAAQQVKPTATSPSATSMGIVETTRPTFKWTGTADATAFMFRINDASGKTVWSNDLQVLPPRDSTGNFVWTAPVFIGTNVCGDAWALDNNTNYTWQVAMFNQKFSRPTDALWSDPAAFRTALAPANDFTTGYGSANIVVRYYGPATNDLANVIVQLYRTADFTGTPVAQTRLFDVDGTVESLTNGQTVAFHGLASGDYYAVAFVDRNGDNVRQKYETWGYAAYVGTGSAAIWTPRTVQVDAENAKVVSAEIYLEDTDINQNDRPDCQDEESLLKTAEAAASGTDSSDADVDGLTAVEEANDTYTDARKWDTDGDLMPDGWEAKFADLDPLFQDAEVVAARDVMAFATEPGKVVSDASGASYLLLAPSNVTYRTGDVVTNEHLATYYDYSTVLGEGTNVTTVTYCGIGTNLVGTAATFKINAMKDVTVAFVHAQVYARFGYSLKPAIPQDGAINTKPFTALDKYMVVRYLAAIGLANEETMNRTGAWSAYTLKPTDPDNDRDGMSDGWELYVMFGTNGCGFVTNGAGEVVHATSLSQVMISPWKFADRELQLDEDGLRTLDEFADGNDPSDPWNTHSVYESLIAEGVIPADTEKFDDKVRRFGIGEDELDDDWDLDLISNGQEMWGYYLDYANKSALLADIDPRNAWSDEATAEIATPDYFRTFVEKPGVTNYLGAYYNGAEFIEPQMRVDLDLLGKAMQGTRDYAKSGWDYWSAARNMQSEEFSALTYTNFEGRVLRTYDDPEEVFELAPEELKKLQRLGEIKLMTLAPLAVTNQDGGVTWYERYGYRDLNETNGGAPQPSVKIALKYAGTQALPITVEAYQVSSAYPEYGEQMSVRWADTANFDMGLAKLTLRPATAQGSLKQGKARFVAYIDRDGSGSFTVGDTFGTVETNVGYLGCDLTIRLGDANKALPSFAFGDGTSPVAQVKIVRTHVNGQPQVNPHTVYKRQYANNVQRATVFPQDYVRAGKFKTGETLLDFIGVDNGLSGLKGDVDSVTYEVLVGRGPFTVEDLTEYGELVSNQVNGVWQYQTNVVSGAGKGIQYTVNYSRKRDIANVITTADQLADDEAILSFTVPTDTPATTFWLKFGGATYPNTVRTDDPKGSPEAGFLLPNAADGVCVIKLRDYLGFTPTVGDYEVQVALGNDRFPKKPEGEAEWSAKAKISICQAKSFKGKLLVKAQHPVDVLEGAKLTVAAYEKADLANPAVVKTGCTAGRVVTLDGLREGKSYYVAAWYVVDDEDGRASAKDRLPYDTWGYLSKIGLQTAGFDALEVRAEEDVATTNVVWLQDTDWNDNGIADRTEKLSAKDGYFTPGGGQIVYDDDFDLDGVPDAWQDDQPGEEEEGGPTTGDVMAYYECTNMQFVALGTMADVTNWIWCAVFEIDGKLGGVRLTDGTIKLQTPATAFSNALYSVYSYTRGEQDPSRWNAIGTNVNYGAEWKVQATRTGRARFLHAQVYALFGFNPKTAVPVADAVNTKNFTDSDKYLVCRYLENVGLAGVDEQMMLTNRAYQWIWTLQAGNPDTDRDGIADGWELYTMFGPTGLKLPSGTDLGSAALTNAVETGILSPFDTADGQAPAPGKGSLLTAIEEYDNGYIPTDPWSLDTDQDGVIDALAYLYRIKSPEDAADDADGDGLSNYAEYLITEVFGLATVDPLNPKTSDGIADAYKKCGKGEFYLGEVFSDHDQMGDGIEDTFGTSRVQFDAFDDSDGNGWSNYADIRAYVGSPRVRLFDVETTDGLVVTNWFEASEYVLDGHPVPTLKLNLIFDSRIVALDSTNAVVTVKAFTGGRAADAVWTRGLTRAEFEKGEVTFELKRADKGYVREGLNDFVCYLGEDSIYQPGLMPYGTVQGVNVGWSGASFAIRLTPFSPIFARLDLYTGGEGGGEASASPDDRITAFGEACGDTMWAVPGNASSNDVSVIPLTASEHVRVVPYEVGGTLTDGAMYEKDRKLVRLVDLVPNRVVAEFDVDPQDKYYLSEADFLGDGKFDIDWDGFRDEIQNNDNVSRAVGDVTSVKYRLVLGREGSLGAESNLDDQSSARAFALLVERRYEPTASRTKPSQLKSAGILSGARPTFSWRLDEPQTVQGYAASSALYGCSYTAFQLQIRDEAGAVVYDSGVRRAPAQKNDGTFEWTAPLCVGDLTAEKKIFGPTGDWTWRVAMYNAKFKPSTREATNGWSADVPFSTAVCSQQEVNDKGYGSIDVVVRYAGPSAVLAKCADVGQLKGLVRVQAFDTPDFSGDPLAATVATNAAQLADTADIVSAVRLVGLKMGGVYYVRAFIDSNGNGVKDDWESWGCVNFLGEQADDISAPKAVALEVSSVKAPVCGLFIDDADTDGDDLPDAWEYAKAGWTGAWEDVKDLESASVDPDGKIVFRGSTYEGIAGISSGLPGASLTVFNNLTVAAEMLGLTGQTTIGAIRAAVKKNVVKDSVKITSLVFDQANGEIILMVDAEVAESVAGKLLTQWYTIDPSDEVEVTVKVFKVDSLGKNWPDVPEVTKTVRFGKNAQTVTVDLDGDYSSGFFKVVVEQ